MKMLGKILSVVIVLLILIFGILSVSGYSYYFGDNKVTVVKGINDLKLSDDLGGGIKFTLVPVTADEIYFDAPMVVDIIEERAAKAGIKDYHLYKQDSTGNVEFIVPNDVNTEYSPVELASFLTCIGDVTIRPGNSFSQYAVDSTGNSLFTGYYDTLSDSVLLDRNYITGAKHITRKVDGQTLHCLDLTLNYEGAAYLAQITDPTANSDSSFYNSVVSFWIDDRMLSYTTLTEHLTDGVLTISDENFTAEKCEFYAAIINTDAMLLQVSRIESVEYHSVSLKMVTLIAGIVLILLAFVLIYRYRLCGVVTLLSVAFQFAALLAICTGFFANTGLIVIDIPAVCAFVFTLFFTVFSCVLCAEKIRNRCSKHTFESNIISSGFKENRTLILDLNVMLTLIAFVGFLMFGTSGFAISLFGNATVGGVYRFSIILLIGSGLNFISAYMLPKFLAQNLKNFKFFAKPSMFGGKKND